MIETAAFTLWAGADAWPAALDRSRLNLWIVSTHLAARHFKHVVLNTDKAGKELLIHDLRLPFTEVRTELNAVPKRESFLYSRGKIDTYRLLAAENRPFLHLDDDFFLWEPPPPRILAARACSQHHYPIHPVLRAFRDRLMPGGGDMSCCSGALGGNDTATILAFAERSAELSGNPANEALLREGCQQPTPWRAPCALEESLFCDFFGAHEGFLPPRSECSDADWIAAGIGHLNGALKQQPMNIARMDRLAKLAWPEAYDRAERLWFDVLARQ